MSKPKPKVAVTCTVCGKVFYTSRSNQRTCVSKECKIEYHRLLAREHYEKYGHKRPPKRHVSASGLTSEQMSVIDRLQDDGDVKALFAASQSWTKEEHKYARARYLSMYKI